MCVCGGGGITMRFTCECMTDRCVHVVDVYMTVHILSNINHRCSYNICNIVSRGTLRFEIDAEPINVLCMHDAV